MNIGHTNKGGKFEQVRQQTNTLAFRVATQRKLCIFYVHIFIYIFMYNMYIVPLTHNLSKTPTYMVQSERKKNITTPEHVVSQQAHEHTHMYLQVSHTLKE